MIAAVFTRAVRDLVCDVIPPKERRQAIRWFLDTETTRIDQGGTSYTYRDIINLLDLSASAQSVIADTVNYIKRESHGQLEAEGEQSRTGNSELVKDLLARVRTSKDSAVLRKQRNIRFTRVRCT